MSAAAARSKTLVVKVDNCLRLPIGGVSMRVLGQIQDALTFENIERERAQREQIHGWQKIPRHIYAWKIKPGVVILPRGFALDLRRGLAAHDITVEWDDHRTDVPIDTSTWKAVDTRDYQEEAIRRIVEVQQGIVKAPPGSGKTVMALEAIRRTSQKALVVVDKSNIAHQWGERAQEFLGIDVGIVGDGQFEVKDVTIALQQTLWSRFEELREANFFREFGFLCLDECHHLPARTFIHTTQHFHAKYRIGVSGTPGKQEGSLPLMEACLGHIFHETSKEELRSKGVLAVPKIRVISTSFRTTFWGTHKNNNHPGHCGVPGCKVPNNRKVHRNNYSSVVTELIRDRDRNELVASLIAHEVSNGKCCIVLSKRLEHLRTLRQLSIDMGVNPADSYMYTGEQNTDERKVIEKRAERGNCVLFSTIADEALDIPRLDTLFLPWPTKNVDIVRQQCGRIERPHPEKGECIVYDFEDDVSVLRNQFNGRLRSVYLPERFTMEWRSGLAA